MTPTPDPIKTMLDGVLEAKLDDKQTGYLWVKLSPKSKKRLTQAINNELLRAEIEGCKKLLSSWNEYAKNYPDVEVDEVKWFITGHIKGREAKGGVESSPPIKSQTEGKK